VDPESPRFVALRQRLGDLGYIEEQNLLIVTRSADEKLDRLVTAKTLGLAVPRQLLQRADLNVR